MPETCDEVIFNLVEEYGLQLANGEDNDLNAYVERLPQSCAHHRKLFIDALLQVELNAKPIESNAENWRDELKKRHPLLSSDIESSSILSEFAGRLELQTALPDFDFLDLYPSGGEGWVARARKRDSREDVVIKIYHDVTPRQYFDREVLALSELNHPLIVRLLERQSTGKLRYLVLEHCPCRNLYLSFRSEPSIRNICSVIDALCTSIQHCHDHGIFHCDLKPENVLANDQGYFKLIDFGHSQEGGGLLNAQMLDRDHIATWAYMPPERATGQKCNLLSIDIFGIGAVLFWLLTREGPFAARNEGESRLRAMRGELNPDAVARAHVRHGELAAICLSAIATYPNERPKTIGEIQAAVRAVAAALVPMEVPEQETTTNGVVAYGSQASDFPTGDRKLTRRQRIEAIKKLTVTLDINRDEWRHAYNPLPSERRLLSYPSSLGKNVTEGEPLAVLGSSFVVVRSPIYGRCLNPPKSRDFTALQCEVAFASVPETLRRAIDQTDLSDDDFANLVVHEAKLIESNLHDQLRKLVDKNSVALRKYGFTKLNREHSKRRLLVFSLSSVVGLLISPWIVSYSIWWLFGSYNPENGHAIVDVDPYRDFGVMALVFAIFGGFPIMLGLYTYITMPRAHPFHFFENQDTETHSFKLSRYGD